MLDIGFSKIAMIGAVALVVLGPEKMPKVARTVGTMIGKLQRYVADVKAEVNRSMDLEELQKVKDSVETAVQEVHQSVQSGVSHWEQNWSQTVGVDQDTSALSAVFPVYRHPRKKWRLKRTSTPQWFKARQGVKSRVQSGAARVARHRPR